MEKNSQKTENILPIHERHHSSTKEKKSFHVIHNQCFVNHSFNSGWLLQSINIRHRHSKDQVHQHNRHIQNKNNKKRFCPKPRFDWKNEIRRVIVFSKQHGENLKQFYFKYYLRFITPFWRLIRPSKTITYFYQRNVKTFKWSRVRQKNVKSDRIRGQVPKVDHKEAGHRSEDLKREETFVLILFLYLLKIGRIKYSYGVIIFRLEIGYLWNHVSIRSDDWNTSDATQE